MRQVEPGDSVQSQGVAVAKDPKVVRGLPLLGSVIEILRDGPGFLTRLARERPGEVVGFRLGPMTVYLITHPDHVEHVLHEHWRSFSKGGMWKSTRALLGNGLIASEGSFWLRQRRMMQPLFSTAHLSAIAETMVDIVDREVGSLAARGPQAVVELAREMGAITQRVILETMFGPGIARSETDRIGEQIHIAFKGMNLRLFLYFLPDAIPLPDERQYRRAIATIDEAMFRLVRARRAGRGSQRGDLISLLLRARDEDKGDGMDDRQIRDELVTLFVAGNDTTASAMTWLWYALTQSPDVEDRLRAEVADVLGERRPRLEDLSRLAYTKQVIQEVMRLYPPAWMFPRFNEREEIVGGYRIPAGSTMLLSPFVSHRSPTFWPDPEVFDPLRFTPERSAGRPRYAYYPFGGGPRQCIGNHFAMMEAQLITVMMLQRLRPRLVPGHRVSLSSVTTLKPRDGLWMTLGSPVASRSGFGTAAAIGDPAGRRPNET